VSLSGLGADSPAFRNVVCCLPFVRSLVTTMFTDNFTNAIIAHFEYYRRSLGGCTIPFIIVRSFADRPTGEWRLWELSR